MAAVNQHCKLYGPGAAERGERVECCADCASGEEHVVDEHHGAF